MEKVLNNFYNFVDKVGKHNVMLIIFIFVVSLVTGLYTTFSIFTSTEPAEILDGLTTYKFILNDDSATNSVTIPANSQKGIEITVSNKEATKLKYGIYYSSSNTLTDVSLGYSPKSQHPATGIIAKNGNYIVTIRIENKSSSDVTIDFGLAFGLENGGDLTLPSGKSWVEIKAYYLSEVEAGSYVAYTGNNGCEGDHCSGANANSSSTSNGYCENSSYEFNSSGWRVAYSNNGNTYIVSAGATDCMCTNSSGNYSLNASCDANASSDEYHFKNLDEISQKYCNTKYVDGGVCNSTTVRAINGNDFEQITGTAIGNCIIKSTENCGSNNNLINNGGYYWVSTPNASMSLASFMDAYNNCFGTEDPEFYSYAYQYSYGVRPVIKLDNKIIITGGTGTEDDPYQISVEKTYLNEASAGEYVAYTGNNGCEGDACSGVNANSSDTSNGYCRSSTYEYNSNGWRIAYIKEGNAYLTTAGSPECLCTNEDNSTSNTSCASYDLINLYQYQHIDNLDTAAIKYCNTKYAANGTCDDSSAWSIDATDFEQITGSSLNDNSCVYESENELCGYNNSIIDNGGFYWYGLGYNPGSGTGVYSWFPDYRYIDMANEYSISGLRPVIKLDSRVTITGGTGTEGDPYQISNNSTYLNQVEVGSYVEYVGDNGCEGDYCKGVNANSSSASNGYCYTETEEFNTSGWRVAYIENGNAYLISAGAPECLGTTSDGTVITTLSGSYETTAGLPLHTANLDDAALKYCNTKYSDGGICNSTTAWAMDGTDYQKITGSSLTVSGCFTTADNCKFSNPLIDNDGAYWVAKTYDDSSNTTYYNKTMFVIRPTFISHNWSYFPRGVRPIIKLDSSVMVTGGTGTEANPYKIVTSS